MKECVYGDRPYDGRWRSDPTDPATEVEVKIPLQSVVDVRWDKETGYFQIATRVIDAQTGGDVYEFPADLRRIYRNEDPPTSDQAEEIRQQEEKMLASWQGMFVTLDRQGINDLIRKLKRARDQAFGKDE